MKSHGVQIGKNFDIKNDKKGDKTDKNSTEKNAYFEGVIEKKKQFKNKGNESGDSTRNNVMYGLSSSKNDNRKDSIIVSKKNISIYNDQKEFIKEVMVKGDKISFESF